MTAQIHENLILDGQATTMAFCPPLPENNPGILELKDDKIEDGRIVLSTSCWRKYVGTWEIKDNKFYLVNIKGKYKLITNIPIFANWFTGTLRIPRGEMLNYVHMGYGSVYENELHIKIENGIVAKSRTISNRDKDVNTGDLIWKNLPGSENRFDGDDTL